MSLNRMQFVVFLLGVCLPLSSGAKSVYIAAASNLTFVLPKLVQAYQQQHLNADIQLKLGFSSTRNLYQQIIRGAPFELFLSADKQSTDLLAAQKLLKQPAQLFAHSELCFYRRKDSILHSAEQLSDLFISDSVRIALANPEVAPFGKAAKQSLRFLGLWEQAKRQQVQAENVAQAASYALSGNVDGAFIACHLAYRPKFQQLGTVLLIPEASYQALEQRLAILKNASVEAEGFARFLLSPSAHSILKQQGYKLP